MENLHPVRAEFARRVQYGRDGGMSAGEALARAFRLEDFLGLEGFEPLEHFRVETVRRLLVVKMGQVRAGDEQGVFVFKYLRERESQPAGDGGFLGRGSSPGRG